MDASDGPDQDPTRRIERPDEWTSTGGSASGPHDWADDPRHRPAETAPEMYEPEPRRGRDLGFAALGALLGILLTFVVIALTTSGGDEDPGGEDAALVDAEAQLAERDRQIDELQARVADLEAQLAEVGDDRADRDAELEAQRDALENRLEAIEARVEELDDREASLDERAAELDRREAELAEAEAGDGRPDPAGGDSGEGDGDGGTDLEDLEETAEGIVDRLLDEVRELFGQGGG